jgi:hypothetical protein
MKAVGLTLLVVGVAFGWWLAPQEQLDEVVHQSGFLQTDRRRVLSATVESLRAQNQLAVYSYKGTVTVRTDFTKFIVFGGDQELIVPAVVTYLVDLAGLTHEYDDQGNIVTVTLPPLKLGDVAFQPEQATILNGGVLTFSQAQVDALLRANYASARRAMTMQAQGEGFVTAARRQAQDNIRTIIQRAAPGVTVSFN